MLKENSNNNYLKQFFDEYSRITEIGINEIINEKKLNVFEYVDDLVGTFDGKEIQLSAIEQFQESISELNLILDEYQFSDLQADTIIGISTFKKKIKELKFLVLVSYTTQSVNGDVYIPSTALMMVIDK